MHDPRISVRNSRQVTTGVLIKRYDQENIPGFVLIYRGLTAQQQPGSYQGGEMMMMKSVFWWENYLIYIRSYDRSQHKMESYFSGLKTGNSGELFLV